MKLYEKMDLNENVGWCIPYLSEDGKSAIAAIGDKAAGIMIDGVDLPPDQINADGIKRLAIAVNEDYNLYKGWSDMHIAAEAMREVGCADCPWRDECDAMQSED